jgi:hypothetical protein
LTVNLTDPRTIQLSGTCPLEDAETLFQRLVENPSATVDWRGCEQAHTAVIQVLMASKCPLRGPPAGNFLKRHVGTALLRLGNPDSTFPERGLGAK